MGKLCYANANYMIRNCCNVSIPYKIYSTELGVKSVYKEEILCWLQECFDDNYYRII